MIYVANLSNDYGELNPYYKASSDLEKLKSSLEDDGFKPNVSGHLERKSPNGYESEWVDIKRMVTLEEKELME